MSLRKTHEEADTHLIFHRKDISKHYKELPHVVIHTSDTDVFLLTLPFNKNIEAPLFYQNWQQRQSENHKY